MTGPGEPSRPSSPEPGPVDQVTPDGAADGDAVAAGSGVESADESAVGTDDAVRRVAVIGGAGFIGSHLVDRLLLEGDRVDVLDDLSTGSLANLSEARTTATSGSGMLKIHHVDAGSSDAAALLVSRRPELVYVLAGVPARRSSPNDLAAAFARTVVVVDAARAAGASKVVTVVPGSVVHGVPAARDLPAKERDVVPRGVRGVVARAVMDLLDVYRTEHALEFTVLALGTVYGPRQRPESGVVAAFRDAHARGVRPRITGDGRQTRDFVHVDDVVDALERAGRRGGGLAINVGTGTQTSIRDLWEAVAGPGAPAAEFVPARPDELPRFALAAVRARIHLGWSPWTSLADGLATMTTDAGAPADAAGASEVDQPAER